jgi:hypothetical protein
MSQELISGRSNWRRRHILPSPTRTDGRLVPKIWIPGETVMTRRVRYGPVSCLRSGAVSSTTHSRRAIDWATNRRLDGDLSAWRPPFGLFPDFFAVSSGLLIRLPVTTIVRITRLGDGLVGVRYTRAGVTPSILGNFGLYAFINILNPARAEERAAAEAAEKQR